MSLEDLTQYIPTQTTAIKRLVQAGHFTSGPTSLAWTEFKDSVWKKGLESSQSQEPVERDEEPIDEDYVPADSVPPLALVATIPDTLPDVWGSFSKRILVRSDYHEAEQTVLSANANHKDALLVTGHHGIGSLPSRLITRGV
jgi:hypothetical protein